jgi:hypothetical protein
MFVGWYVVQAQAGRAAAFAGGLGLHDAPAALQGDRVGVCQVEFGVDALGLQLGADAPAHSPHLGHVRGLQQCSAFGVVHRAQVAHLGLLAEVLALLRIGQSQARKLWCATCKPRARVPGDGQQRHKDRYDYRSSRQRCAGHWRSPSTTSAYSV